MKNKKIMMLAVTLVMLAGTAAALTWLRTNQRLGTPGLKATPIPGSVMMKVDLPERVLDFTSTNVPEPDVAIGYFPKDTSYAERFYSAPDGFKLQSIAVLMGADRTSIHPPEFCLAGQGWDIDEKQTINIPINDQPPYQLQAAAWKLSQTRQLPDGEKAHVEAVYVYWYVANNEETPDHHKMLEWLTLDFLRTGTLQRWAYISYFSQCQPGQEDATIDRIKKFIIASVPEFQLPLTQK